MTTTPGAGCLPGARLTVIAAGLAGLALLTLSLNGAPVRAARQSSIPTVAVDADPSGNGPRAVAGIQQCLSASLGQPADIDIVLPGPGVPIDGGIAAYQFNLFYDPGIVWIGADDPNQLLDQAAGSSVVPIADAKPDKDGVYRSWAVDFGPRGIEPAGASETGPGVLARLTLIPQDFGASPLILKDVLIIDNASQIIAVDSIESATINVGQRCPEQSETETPSLTAATATATPTASPTATPTSAPTPTPAVATALVAPTLTPTPTAAAAPDAATLTGFSATGGPPSPSGSSPLWLVGAGLGALGVASLVIGGTLAFPHRRGRREATFHERDLRSRGDRHAGH